MFKLCWLSSVPVFASAVTVRSETERNYFPPTLRLFRGHLEYWTRVRPTRVIQHCKCSNIHTQEVTCTHLILSTLPAGRRRNCSRLFAVIPRILEGQCWKKDFRSPLFLIYGQCRNIVRRHAVNLTHSVPFVKTYVIKISVWTPDWTLDWFDSHGKTSFIPVSWLHPIAVVWIPPSFVWMAPPRWSQANVATLVTAEHLVRLMGNIWWHRRMLEAPPLICWSTGAANQQGSKQCCCWLHKNHHTADHCFKILQFRILPLSS